MIGQPVIDALLSPNGYEQITVLTSAQGLTVPAGTIKAIIQPTGQAVRWRDDGTNPTATIGLEIAVGDVLEYGVTDFTKIKFIEVAPTAILNISYYK